jgi:hypothetical protein
MVMCGVLFAVRPKLLNIIHMSFVFKGLKLYDSVLYPHLYNVFLASLHRPKECNTVQTYLELL